MQSTLSEPNYSQEIRRFRRLKTRSCTHIPIGSQNLVYVLEATMFSVTK